MYDNYSLSKRLVELRTQAGISQEKLAEMAEISDKYVGQIERGVRNPTVKVMSKICDALGITLSDFFSNEKDLNDRFQNSDSLSRYLSKKTKSEKKLLDEFVSIIQEQLDNN